MDTSITIWIFVFLVLASGGTAAVVYILNRLKRRMMRKIGRLDLGLEDLRTLKSELGIGNIRHLVDELANIRDTLNRNFLTDLVHLNRNHWHDVSPRRVCLPDHAFRMPGYYGGFYMWPEEFEMLSRYVGNAQVGYLEIGSFTGLSVTYLAQIYPELPITCVDAFDAGHATLGGVEEIFQKNRALLPPGRITLIRGYSHDVLPSLSQDYDVILVDADHSYEAVSSDARMSLQILRPGGVLLFHDYSYVPETTRAVDEFIAAKDGTVVLEQKSGLIAVRKGSRI
jgi:hypothetical protein